MFSHCVRCWRVLLRLGHSTVEYNEFDFKRLLSGHCMIAMCGRQHSHQVPAISAEFYNAWHSTNSAIVLDAYEYTPIDWSKMKNNKRLAGFINKASDGVSPQYQMRAKHVVSCQMETLCRCS